MYAERGLLRSFPFASFGVFFFGFSFFSSLSDSPFLSRRGDPQAASRRCSSFSAAFSLWRVPLAWTCSIIGEAIAGTDWDFCPKELYPWGRTGRSFLGQGVPVAARDLPVGERNSPRELDLPEASRNKSPNSLKVRSKIRQASEYYMEVLGVSGMTVG